MISQNRLIKQWKNLSVARIRQLMHTPAFRKCFAKLERTDDKKVAEVAERVHRQIFTEIDCLECANCCKSIPPIINQTDANRIARFLRIKPTAFMEQYTRVDEDGDLVMRQSPCPFLGADHYCSVYDVRPKSCRAYPHTEGHAFPENLKLHPVNAVYCPAVYYILHEMKHRFGEY